MQKKYEANNKLKGAFWAILFEIIAVLIVGIVWMLIKWLIKIILA